VEAEEKNAEEVEELKELQAEAAEAGGGETHDDNDAIQVRTPHGESGAQPSSRGHLGGAARCCGAVRTRLDAPLTCVSLALHWPPRKAG
jgi:hypothetical protein